MFKKKDDTVKILNSVCPEERQIKWQETEFSALVYFGLNTFVGKEETYGNVEANAFFPTDINIPDWISTFKNAGMKGAILTVKHHDGFCLWRTKTTDYSVANSPYLDSKGDIFREFTDACREGGLKAGFQFSLCDRNTDKSGKELDDLICDQLTELLTEYGNIYEVKFDLDGEKNHEYDMKRYVNLIRKLQPDAAIVNGPDVRHIGNKKAICRPEEWNVIKPVNNLQKITRINPDKENTYRTPDGAGQMELDLGSRKALKKANSLCWQPVVVDYSIRDSWFYNRYEDEVSMFLQNLKKLYFSVVGANASLELGIPVDQRGQIHDAEKLTLDSFGIDMKILTKNPLLKDSEIFANCGGDSIRNLLKEDSDGFNSGKTDSPIEITINFKEEKIIKLISLGENIKTGQQIEQFSIYTLEGKKFKKAETHGAVGYKKLILPKKPMVTSAIKIVIEKTREFATLKNLEIYSA
ncbi:MAG: alpha-L-fucosidase [Clostridia bacterium]|nr:alpha-L-fucosidase [Clostridia bacterium]